MKWFITLCLLVSVATGIVGIVTSRSRVSDLEDELRYSMGLAGESRWFSFSEPVRDAVTDPESIQNEPVAGGSIFSRGSGSKTFYIEDLPAELSDSIAKKIPAEGDVDYRGFAFTDRLPPLTSVLSDEELVYVFAQIVSSAGEKVPIDGRLETITFVNNGEYLYAFARIVLDTSGLAEKYGIVGLANVAVFSLSMCFVVKNSYISVDFEKLHVHCETMELPEALLIFGCDLAFGKRDYKKVFEEAIKTVFVNAGIYR